MNKKLQILLCVVLVILVVLVLAFCGKKEQKGSTGPATEPTMENAQSAEMTPTTAEQQVETTQPTETEATEPEVIMTDPVTGETTDVKVGMGIVDGDGSSDLEEGETTGSTEPTKPTESTQPTEPTEPSEATKPSESTTPTLPDGLDIRDITYEMYMAMSGEEQQAVIAQFGSIDDFMVWFNAVKAIYEAEHPNIEVGGGAVDGSQIGK